MAKRMSGPDAELKVITDTIKADVRELKRLNERGDYSRIVVWVVPGKLACAPRPLRHHHIYKGSGIDLPREARPELNRWIERVHQEGIASIIAVISDKELQHYSAVIPQGLTLVDYYRNFDLSAEHIRWDDPFDKNYRGFGEEVREKRVAVFEAYDRLSKPVLIHCSAAIDRSPPIVAYICQRVRVQ